MPQFIIGIDVDGVVADLVSPVLTEIEQKIGRHISVNDVDRFDLSQVLGEECWALAQQILCTPGFALTLPLYPGAKDAIDKLRRIGRVVFVTTPNPHSSTWSHDRTSWLVNMLDTQTADIMHVFDKSLFAGHVLIDDAPSQLESFASSNRPAIRIVRPWNKGSIGLVAESWDDVLLHVETLAATLASP